MRRYILGWAERYPAVFRLLLACASRVSPPRFIFWEISRRCGAGRYPCRVRLGNGMKMRGFFADMVTTHIARSGWYEPTLVSAIREKLDRNCTFFDVGANIGQETLLAAPLCKHVFSFEPDPEVFAVLSENVRLNGLTNVTLVNAAVSNSKGTATFHRAPGSNLGAGSLYGEGEAFTVNTVTLDDFFVENAVIKIDAEGAEAEIIAGGQRTLLAARAVFMEALPSLQQRAGRSSNEIVSALEKLHYSLSAVDDHNLMAVRRQDIPEFSTP